MIRAVNPVIWEYMILINSCYRYATLGAKKSADQTEPNGETPITIAGVTKKAGGAEYEKLLENCTLPLDNWGFTV